MQKINRYWNSDPDSLVEYERPETYDLCKSCECINQLLWKEKRLKRALWLARAESAKNAKCRYYRLAQKEVCDPQPHGWSCYINGEVYPTDKITRRLEPHYWCDVWEEVERRCRAKAEEYK